jgi:hypothetical protein
VTPLGFPGVQPLKRAGCAHGEQLEEHRMKKTILAAVLFSLLAFGVFADNVRFGLFGGLRF